MVFLKMKSFIIWISIVHHPLTATQTIISLLIFGGFLELVQSVPFIYPRSKFVLSLYVNT